METQKIETKEEGVLTILENGNLIAISYKDLKTHHNIFYKVEEMSMDELKDFLMRS